MHDRNFKPTTESNGILHPPNCACVKCAAGRESLELGDSLLQRVKEVIDETFLEQLKGNLHGGMQALAQGQPIAVVRGGFLTNMANMFTMREMASAYFADQNREET